MQCSVDVIESVAELLRDWCRYAVIPLAGLSRRSAAVGAHGHVMQPIIKTLFNPLDAGRRYTDFAQTFLRRRTAVYRPNGSLPHAPEDGIPAARCIVDPRRRTVYNPCFLMHTGPSIPKS